MVGTLEGFEDAMSTALAFVESAVNSRHEATKAALWGSAELWLAEAAAELERAESGR